MKLITHWRCRRWLSAYLDGELTGEAQERVVPLTGAPLAVLPGDTIRVAERHF